MDSISKAYYAGFFGFILGDEQRHNPFDTPNGITDYVCWQAWLKGHSRAFFLSLRQN